MYKKKPVDGFRDFNGYDRRQFPDKVIRVTAGAGGEALLIAGSLKTALLDCGMAYCAEELIANIKEACLEENRQLDYILLSHTHYDHIGALPYVLMEWPEAVVCGAEYCRKVFNSEGARRKMAELGKIAAEKYTKDPEATILVEGLRLDVSLSDGEKLYLGEEYIVALETKGHTDCSMTYVLEPDGIMFASESTGVLESPEFMHIPILKSYSDSMASIEKCSTYPINHLISPHYGSVPDFFIREYWEMCRLGAQEKRDYLYQLHQRKLDFEAILMDYAEKYWNDARGEEQPKEAFMENAGNIIRAIMKDFD